MSQGTWTDSQTGRIWRVYAAPGKYYCCTHQQTQSCEICGFCRDYQVPENEIQWYSAPAGQGDSAETRQ